MIVLFVAQLISFTAAIGGIARMPSKSFRLLSMTFAFCVLTNTLCNAQSEKLSPAAFRAKVAEIQRQTLVWERLAASLRLEDLPIEYAQGKLIDQEISTLKGNIQLERGLCAAALNKDSLSGEIQILVVLSDISRGFEAVADDLTNLSEPTSTSTEKKIVNISSQFANAGGKEINDTYIEVYTYVLDHADEIESQNRSK